METAINNLTDITYESELILGIKDAEDLNCMGLKLWSPINNLISEITYQSELTLDT